MENLLLKQGNPCNRNIIKMGPIQGNPCSLNRFSPCNVCFCFDFHDYFSFCRVQWTGISLCILQLFYVPNTELEGLLWYHVIFTGSLQGRITTQGDPCNLYREGVCSVALLLLTFPPSWSWPLLAILHNIEPRDRTDYNNAFHFEGFMM
jgi:hypothetical protein